MFESQTDLVFPTHAVPPAGPLPRGAQELSVRTEDSEMLKGIHIPADGPGTSHTLILGFGGNAWNGQDVAEYLHELFPRHEVVVFHYRGYRPSSGSPSAKALIADAPQVYDAAIDRLRPARTIAIGFSIGSGIVAQLSAVRRLDGIILVTAFDSLKAVAQSLWPWLPMGVLFSHEIDAATPLKGSHAPVAIIGAEQDELIVKERSEALIRVVPNLVFNRTIAGAGHNDIYARSAFHEAMHEAMDRLNP